MMGEKAPPEVEGVCRKGIPRLREENLQRTSCQPMTYRPPYSLTRQEEKEWYEAKLHELMQKDLTNGKKIRDQESTIFLLRKKVQEQECIVSETELVQKHMQQHEIDATSRVAVVKLGNEIESLMQQVELERNLRMEVTQKLQETKEKMRESEEMKSIEIAELKAKLDVAAAKLLQSSGQTPTFTSKPPSFESYEQQSNEP